MNRFRGALGRVGRRTGFDRRAGVELGAVSLAFAALTVWANWGAVTGLTTTAPDNLGDPLYFAWQLAWVGHAVRDGLLGSLWTTNAFLQAPGNLAFTDTLLGYVPLSWLVPDGQAGALAQLNLATLLATALAALGAYLLARLLGANVAGALLAGAATGFAPWRLTQVNHLNVISTCGTALALGLLARGFGWSLRDGWQPERMSARYLIAAWVVACWQLSLGFALGIWFVYSMAFASLALLLGWLIAGRRRVPWSALPRRVLVAQVAGGAGFLVTLGLLLPPYLAVLSDEPGARRTASAAAFFSPPWYGLLTAPTTDWFWGDKQLGWRAQLDYPKGWPGEMIMSPGAVLLGVALVGLVYSAWPWRRRLALGATTAVLTVLALGTKVPGDGHYTFLPLYHALPGWQHLRTPGRMMVWVTLGLALLAAGTITRLTRDVRDVVPAQRLWRGLAGVALVLPAAAAYGEGWNTVSHWQVSHSPVALASLPQPVLVLPTDLVADYHIMLWSTEGWPVLANGDSGFASKAQTAMREQVAGFPDAASVAALRRMGVHSVVLVRDRVSPGKWDTAADADITGLGITRTQVPNAVVFGIG